MQQRSSFDFSAFDILDTSWSSREYKRISKIGLPISALLIIASVFVVGRLGLGATGNFQAVILVASLCVAAMGWFISRVYGRILLAARAAFAAQNGGSISTSLDLSREPGVIFSARRKAELAGNVICGTINGLPFQQYKCSYRYIGEDGSTGRRTTAVLAVGLPHSHPQMIINSLTDTGGEASLPVRFAKDQHIQLEGDFNRYFAVYTPNGHELSAVGILAPDVMQVLLDHARKFDIELVGNRLYFYWQPHTEDKDEYTAMFASAQRILREIQHKLIRRPAAASDLSGRVAGAGAPAGLRVKFNPGIILNIILAGILIIFGILFAYSAVVEP